MDELQFTAKVEELARRTGHAPPPVTRVEGQPERECIWLEPPGPVGPMLFVHRHINEQLPDAIQEFQIAQEFVQANQDVGAQRRRTRRLAGVVNLVVLAVVLIGALLIFRGHGGYLDAVLYLLVGVPAGYVLGRAGALFVYHLWARRFMRRTDLGLIEVLGREQLMDALRWHGDTPYAIGKWWARRDLKWVLSGAPPTPLDRLRRLSSGTD
jgi:hypothetical protein